MAACMSVLSAARVAVTAWRLTPNCLAICESVRRGCLALVARMPRRWAMPRLECGRASAPPPRGGVSGSVWPSAIGEFSTRLLRLRGMVTLTIRVWPVLLPALEQLAAKQGVSVEAWAAQALASMAKLRLGQAAAGARAATKMTPQARSERARTAAHARWR